MRRGRNLLPINSLYEKLKRLLTRLGEHRKKYGRQDGYYCYDDEQFDKREPFFVFHNDKIFTKNNFLRCG